MIEVAGMSPPATAPFAHIGRRLAACATIVLLVGCSRSPASLGLTGAVPPQAPETASDALIGTPGVHPGDGLYTPSLTPSTGGGRYFGYQD